MIEKIIAFIAKLPSTQIRILVTVAIWTGTAIWVWTGGVPSTVFLGTIVAMSGLDAMTFGVKRATSHKPEEVARAHVIKQNGSGADYNPNPSIERNGTTEDERG